jgi:hypothetical protein
MNYLIIIMFIIFGVFLSIGLGSYFGNIDFVEIIMSGGIFGLLLYIAIKQK